MTAEPDARMTAVRPPGDDRMGWRGRRRGRRLTLMGSVSGPGGRPVGPRLEALHQRAAQADNLSAVQEVAVAVTAVHESSVIAALAAEKACQLVGGDGADLCWWDDEADLLTPLAGHRTATTYQTRPSSANEGAIGEAFSRREPVLVPDYQAWPQALPWISAAGIQSVVAVPLMVRDQVLGALAVNSHRPHAFQSDQVELLSRLASLVTPDLEAAHMLESRDLQVRGLTALQEVAVAASGMLDAEALARLTVDRATALLGVDSAVLRWWDERAGELRLLASNDRNPARHGRAIGPDRGVIGRAFREGRAVTIGDYGHSEVSLPGVAQDGVMTAMAVPLTVGDRTVGGLAVATYRPHRYDALQSRLLSLFAAQVAPAIEAARLAADFAVISQMAIDAVVELLGASSAGIGWWDPEAAALTGVAGHLKDPAAQAVTPDEGILGQVFATGRAVVVPDYPDWEHRRQWSVALGHKSMLAVPLLLQDRTVGALIARFKERREFDGDELQVLVLIASSMAPMLEAARLHGDLAASERSLRVLHGVMACGVEVIDSQGRILEMNDSALAMFGLRRDQLDGRMPAEIAGLQRITEEGIPLAWDQRPVAVAMRTRKPVRNAVVGYRRADGTEFWLQFDCVPMLDAGGRVEQLISTFIDVTSVKIAETVRRESEAKSRFLATMSHELRTPLNSILGFAQLLDGEAYGDLNERQRRYLGHISTSGRHLLALVNDVLDLSKVAAGQMELAMERLEVDPMIHEVLERLRPMADARQLEVTIDATPGLALRADRRRLEQVLANLVSNAIKFTPEKGQRDRDPARTARADLHGVHPGRGWSEPPPRGHRAGPAPQPPPGRADGGPDLAQERPRRRQRVQLHPPLSLKKSCPLVGEGRGTGASPPRLSGRWPAEGRSEGLTVSLSAWGAGEFPTNRARRSASRRCSLVCCGPLRLCKRALGALFRRASRGGLARPGRALPRGRFAAPACPQVGWVTSDLSSCQAWRASSTEPSSSIVEMSPGSLSSVTAFRTRRMILPLRVLGSMATKLRSPITATGPSSRRTVFSSSVFSSAEGCRPCLRTTKAEITSMRTGSGRPVTPASATAGWRRNAVSTSIVPIRWPAILMISSARPLNHTYPSSSMAVASPLKYRSCPGTLSQ